MKKNYSLIKSNSEVGDFDFLIYQSFLRLNGLTPKGLREISQPNQTCRKMDGNMVEHFIEKRVRLNNRNFDK